MAFIAGTAQILEGWSHITFVYRGSETGLFMYFNGVLAAAGTTPQPLSNGPAVGKTVIGRYDTNVDDKYSTVVMDEITMWNVVLTDQDVQDLFNPY